MSRPTISTPGGDLPVIGAAAKQPQQPAIVMANDKGEPVVFPCVATNILTDHAMQQLVTLIAATVDAALEHRGFAAVGGESSDIPAAPAERPGHAADGAPAVGRGVGAAEAGA